LLVGLQYALGSQQRDHGKRLLDDRGQPHRVALAARAEQPGYQHGSDRKYVADRDTEHRDAAE
jgi:hypothetical protein